jgi:hypothetical protein
METEQLIERCITTLEADIHALQQALDSRRRTSQLSKTETSAPISSELAEALLRSKRTMLSNLLRERGRCPPRGSR